MAYVLNFKLLRAIPHQIWHHVCGWKGFPCLWMARLSMHIRKSESLESLIGHSLLLVFHMWSIVKSCRFHHPSTCQSCLHFSLSTSIPQTLSSLHFSWSPDNRRTSPLVHTHPLHPQDPAIFSRGKSDLVTAVLHFSAQSPYVGFHCSVVKVHNSHGGLQQHLPFWPHPYTTVPWCSVTQSCPTLCDPMNCSTPGLPVHHQFLEFTQTHVQESMMPSNHLILCRPLLLLPSNFPNVRVFSNKSALCIRWPKYWSFGSNISPSNEHPGLISFRMDWLDLLPVQGTLKSLLQHHSSQKRHWCIEQSYGLCERGRGWEDLGEWHWNM